jgi:hypothetical protein
MLSSNLNNNIFLSFLISKEFIANSLFYQKQKYVVQLQVSSLTRKEYLALLKYILFVLSFGNLPNAEYTKIYQNQKHINYKFYCYFLSKVKRTNCFILQKLFQEEKKKKKSLVFENNFIELCVFYYDVIHEHFINNVPVTFLQQKIFFWSNVSRNIFSQKQKYLAVSNILLQYDFFSFLGCSFIKK